MSRERGEKGKQGETDRQIVFAILHNQLRDPRGLTKKQIAEVVQAATRKDQDGVRKRVAHMLGDQSPLKQMIQMENIDLKHFYKFNLRNIKDAAILYNFMHRGGDFLGEEEFDTYISENLLAYEEDLIDYLYLWDPFSPVYGLPEHLIKMYRDFHAFDFYPKQFKNVGPEKMKEVARDFEVFKSGLLEQVMQDPKRMGRLCKLIENFETFITPFDNDPDFFEMALDDPVYSDDVTAGDMYWFLGMWDTSWKIGMELKYIVFYEGRIEALRASGIIVSSEKHLVYPYVKFVESGSYYQFRQPVRYPKEIKNKNNKEEPKNGLDNWIWKED